MRRVIRLGAGPVMFLVGVALVAVSLIPPSTTTTTTTTPQQLPVLREVGLLVATVLVGAGLAYTAWLAGQRIAIRSTLAGYLLLVECALMVAGLGVGFWFAPDPDIRDAFRHPIGDRTGVMTVAFAPDGRQLAGGAFDGTVRVWDVASGGERLIIVGGEQPITSVAYSPDGSRLVSGAYDGMVRVWDSATGVPERWFTGHVGPVTSLAYSPDGTRVASGGRDGTVRIWDPATGAEVHAMAGHSGPVTSVAYSPNGQVLASTGADALINLWDPVAGKQLRSHQAHSPYDVRVAFSPDGSRLAFSGEPIWIWDLATDEERSLPGSWADWLFFSPDGARVISVSIGDQVAFWNVATGAQERVVTGPKKWLTDVALSPEVTLFANGTEAALANDEDTVMVWNPAAETPARGQPAQTLTASRRVALDSVRFLAGISVMVLLIFWALIWAWRHGPVNPVAPQRRRDA